MTVDELQARRSYLVGLIATGQRRMSQGDKAIEWGGTADLIRALEFIDGQLAAATAPATRSRVRLGYVAR